MGEPVRVVVFDIGGVLIPITPWADSHTACGLAPEQLPPLDDFLPRLSQLNAAFDRGDLDEAEFEAAVLHAAGGRYKPHEVWAVHAGICRPHFPGVHEIFDDLHAAGLETGILSNTNARHWLRLAGIADEGAEYPVIRRATHLHASFLFRCSKPERAIYDAFAAAANADPAAILFFDDLQRNVEGAREAGWRAERIDPTAPVAAQIRGWLGHHEVLGEGHCLWPSANNQPLLNELR